VMWVPGSAPFLVALLYMGIKWFEMDDRRARDAVVASR
jgi:hypothetical protein